MIDATRLKNLFVALYRDNEFERNGAASRLYKFLIDQKIHPEDIELSVGAEFASHAKQMFAQFQRQIAALQNENLFFRRKAGEATIREAIAAGKIDYRWFAFEDLVRTRLSGPNGDLPRHYRSLLAQHLSVSLREINRWEQGVSQIPDAAFTAVEALPLAGKTKTKRVGKPAKALKTPKTTPGQYHWPDHVLEIGVRKWLAGAAKTAVQEAMQEAEPHHEITDNMVINRIEQNGPPGFLNARKRELGQPLHWDEFWLLSATLFLKTTGGKRERGWRSAGLRFLGLHSMLAPPSDLNAGTTQERIDALRNLYVEHNLKVSAKVRPGTDMFPEVANIFVKAGPSGATRSDVAKTPNGNKHLRRISELERALRLFDTGERVGSEKIYAASEFAAHHAAAWRIAQQTFGRTAGGSS